MAATPSKAASTPSKAAATASAVPALTRPRRARKPALAERTTSSGLQVIAVRKPGVPVVELRLRVPFLSAKPTHPARATLLAETMLTAAGEYDRAGLAAALQDLGADLSVGVDADRLVISGSTLAPRLPDLLAMLATVLTEAGYPAGEVAIERDRLTERLSIARSRSGVIASETLGHVMWGDQPYAVDLPRAEAVDATTAAHLRSLHASSVRPQGATLVLVGDLSPARAIDQAERALAAWTGAAARSTAPPLTFAPVGPVRVVDRPGSVQSSLRFGASALDRHDERWPALQLANLIFGGYFSSRWTENIREDKGYTYGPHSRVDHAVLGSTLLLEVEVATEVTAPAVLETLYELGRIATLPVTDAELDAVRQYAIGTLALSTATQAGMASTLSSLAGFGLGLDWVLEHPARLAAVTIEDVGAAAAEFLAPTRLATVIVGDAATITAPLRHIVPVA